MKSLCRMADLYPTASHPARGAWIEMFLAELEAATKEVAPRKGCVD